MDFILAADEHWAIGNEGQLLFHLPPDMRRFVQLTTGGILIMGRKTLESLPGGNPLKGRLNVVLTRNPAGLEARHSCIPFGKLDVAPDGDGALVICRGMDELAACLRIAGTWGRQIWVIGGAEIYRLLMPYCQVGHVTRIMAVATQADAWVENLDEAKGWQLAERGPKMQWQGLRFRYDRYVNHEVKGLP